MNNVSGGASSSGLNAAGGGVLISPSSSSTMILGVGGSQTETFSTVQYINMLSPKNSHNTTTATMNNTNNNSGTQVLSSAPSLLTNLVSSSFT